MDYQQWREANVTGLQRYRVNYKRHDASGAWVESFQFFNDLEAALGFVDHLIDHGPQIRDIDFVDTLENDHWDLGFA